MSYLYIIALTLLIFASITTVLLMKHFKNIKVTNIIFIGITFVCYLLVVLIAFIKNGLYDWNFLNTLPTANVSPFIFCISPLFFVFPQKIKKYLGALFALLTIGMFLSPIISSVYYFSISYQFHFSFAIDYIAHFSFALFGIYLVHSKQVELTFKNALIGAAIIIVVALMMVVINLIFDTSFFGLSLRGKHNIYNQVLVDNSYLSTLIYFSGLLTILAAGFGLQKLLLKLMK